MEAFFLFCPRPLKGSYSKGIIFACAFRRNKVRMIFSAFVVPAEQIVGRIISLKASAFQRNALWVILNLSVKQYV